MCTLVKLHGLISEHARTKVVAYPPISYEQEQKGTLEKDAHALLLSKICFPWKFTFRFKGPSRISSTMSKKDEVCRGDAFISFDELAIDLGLKK